MADITNLPPDPRLFGWPDPVGTDVPEELRCYRVKKSWQATIDSVFLTGKEQNLLKNRDKKLYREGLIKTGKMGIFKKGFRRKKSSEG